MEICDCEPERFGLWLFFLYQFWFHFRIFNFQDQFLYPYSFKELCQKLCQKPRQIQIQMSFQHIYSLRFCLVSNPSQIYLNLFSESFHTCIRFQFSHVQSNIFNLILLLRITTNPKLKPNHSVHTSDVILLVRSSKPQHLLPTKVWDQILLVKIVRAWPEGQRARGRIPTEELGNLRFDGIFLTLFGSKRLIWFRERFMS